MNAITISLLALVSTGVGGVLALRYRDRLHLILGFTAGVLLGVVAFDILPEAFGRAHAHGSRGTGAMIALVCAFLLFHSLEKFLLVHPVHEAAYAHHHHPHVGVASALALIGHSFMDGIGIGLGFQVSEHIGVVIAIAVIAHDFCDGLNTVSLMLMHQNSVRRAALMLVLDAVAPVLGAVSTLTFTLSSSALELYLGFFAGFLLYIGASDILPEAHSRTDAQGSLLLLLLTTSGAAAAFFVARFLA
jgi:ZIP family zinc transporter